MEFKFSFNVSDDDNDIETDTSQKQLEKPVEKAHKLSKVYTLSSIKSEWISNESEYLYTFESLSFKNGFQLNYVQGQNDDISQIGTSNRTDIIPKVYEGGLKIWECSLDLIEYCLENDVNFEGKSVLDLGCGIGITGLCAAKLGARCIVFQDFNDFVLLKTTGPSVLLQEWEQQGSDNCDKNVSISDIITGDLLSVNDEKYTFLSGSWEENQKTFDRKCDIILTSETIYDCSSYQSLTDFMLKALGKNGVIYLSAKSFYFGVGGGTQLFIDFVNKQGYFKIESVKTIDAPLQREILKLELL